MGGSKSVSLASVGRAGGGCNSGIGGGIIQSLSLSNFVSPADSGLVSGRRTNESPVGMSFITVSWVAPKDRNKGIEWGLPAGFGGRGFGDVLSFVSGVVRAAKAAKGLFPPVGTWALGEGAGSLSNPAKGFPSPLGGGGNFGTWQ